MKKNMQLSVLMHLRYICMAFIIAFGFITLIATGGCGGGGGTPAPGPGVTTVSGTAAAGLPIVGTINIRGSNGSISSSAIESDGSFSVDILALTAPFVMWAEGMSGGKFVRLYSCIAGGGIANVTPATNMIMAMALGDDPATVYADGSTAGAPDFGAIETAKQQIAVRLESVFANMNMPEDFDLMNGSFEANGEGFDALLDTVDMTYDATDKKVAIKDKVTDTTLFEKEVDTGITSVDLDADAINTVVMESATQIAAMENIMNVVNALYTTGAATIEQMQAQWRPLMADDFLNNGMGPDDWLAFLVNSNFGQKRGGTIDGFHVHRSMISATAPDGGTFIEFSGAYTEGVWCVYRYTEQDGISHALTSFVKGADGVWKMYGNRNPFVLGGMVDVQALRKKSDDDPEEIHSGFSFYTDDAGNQARDNLGIETVAVLNSALPQLPDNEYHGLILIKDDPLSTVYRIIKSEADAISPSTYVEGDGLAIDKIESLEFWFVGLDGDGNIVHRWIDLIGHKPIESDQLNASYFPNITEPASLDPNDLDFPGEVTMTWTNPLGMYADWVSFAVLDTGTWIANGSTNMNPAYSEESVDFDDWTSDTLTTSSIVGEVAAVVISVYARDQYERHFATVIQAFSD